MDVKTLLAAYDAVDMLRALGLPVSEEQLRAISEMEKRYIRENVLVAVKQQVEPLFQPLRNGVRIEVFFTPEDGLNYAIVDRNVKESRSIEVKEPSGERTMYSFDGGKPLNKRRFVLAVVKEYVKSHPGLTFEELEKRFPSLLSRSVVNGVVRKYEDVRARIATHPDLSKRFFLDPEDIIRLSDGTKIVVYNQWGSHFADFLTVTEELHRVDVFE